MGIAYTGFERMLLALDLRFLDFRDTNGFHRGGFNKDGSVAGLGWQNVFALAAGGQSQLADALTIHACYSVVLNPADNSVNMFNLLSSTIIQHAASVAILYDVT